MKYQFQSTRLGDPSVDLWDALVDPITPSGGLYMPGWLEPIPQGDLDALAGASWSKVAIRLCRALFPQVEESALERIVRESFSFPIKLVEVGDNRFVLELFHGPTRSFKDFGARFMARLIGHLNPPEAEPLTILVATSGDTGSAVAQAFHGVPGTRVVVLYPRGRISEVQEAQIASIGANVLPVAIDGAFDDCQAHVKALIGDPTIRRELRFTSANSINLGRLLPQSLAYAFAVTSLHDSQPPLFVVPSGNFGNLTAGIICERLGLAISGFVGATNANDPVPRYLQGAEYKPIQSVRTISSAMDVGSPNNFQRLQYLFEANRERMAARIIGYSVSDSETRETIRTVYGQTGYILDPHTAVGFRALEAVRHRQEPRVVLGTAHPAKFPDEVARAIGKSLEIPADMIECMEKPRLAVECRNDRRELLALIRDWPGS